MKIVVRNRTERGSIRASRESVRPMACDQRSVNDARIFSGLRSNPPAIGRIGREAQTAARACKRPTTAEAEVAGSLRGTDYNRHRNKSGY